MPQPSATSSSRPRFEWHWLGYSLPCGIVWSVYLLSFFPGSMSPDSIAQWEQLSEFRFDDVHPVFHTLTNWLITRVWLSPAAVGIAQIIGLALVFGLTMRELELMNVPRWVRVAITLLFSLSPVNGFMSITLWKDVPYSIALLALWMLFLRIVRTNESVLAAPRFLVGLVLVLLAASLYRHNGLPVVVFVLLTLGWLCRDHRRQVALTGIAWVAGFLFVKIVLYGMLDVAPAPPSFVYMLPIHQVIALRRSTPLMPEEARFLDSMAQPEIWNFYRCTVPNAAIYLTSRDYAGQFNHDFFDRHTNDFLRVWLALAMRNPWALFQHQLCMSNMLWRVMPLPGSYLYTAQLGISPNDLGLQTQSLLPQMQSFLGDGYEWSMSPAISWWFWRPALHLFFVLAILLFVRFRHRHVVLLLSVPLFQLLVLFLLIAGQDTRYQYPIYLIALVAPGLLFARQSE